MILFKKAKALSDEISELKKQGKTIGFVPTMGALHPGHLSLIAASRKENDITVCSIFVNPTQFNNPEDYRLYPITIEQDLEQLLSQQCDIAFLPSVDEIYPAESVKKKYALGEIETILEGHYRPGHFQGVCQVVDRLLDIVHPDRIYLGQKDFQQCMVIKKLIRLIGKEDEIELEVVPTMREADGLAMSSRNLRLNELQRKQATSIYKELNEIRQHLHDQPLDQLKIAAKEHLTQKGFDVDYIEIAHADDLSTALDTDKKLVTLAAASIGSIRLIDNLLLN
jgi:pantoate--beta-alanine ligase